MIVLLSIPNTAYSKVTDTSVKYGIVLFLAPRPLVPTNFKRDAFCAVYKWLGF